MQDILQYLEERRSQCEEDLCALLRIPSVSAVSSHADDVRTAAGWLVDYLARRGLDVELHETAGHPIVQAQTPEVAGAARVLVYGHYDVQPPDPLDQWISPPFEPTRRNGNLYARGATDDKGQMLTHVMSTAAWLACRGELPIQVKFLIEGEEEVGSAHLEEFVRERADSLACDVVVISDTAQFARGQPAITYGLRGIAYYELTLRGPTQDLHSGSFGGAVTNPATALAQLLASIVDDQGRVQVPGFYDDVVPLAESERNQLAALPFDEAAFQRAIGVDGTSGEAGYSNLERRWCRPSYDVCGIASGYQGEGAKTIIPAAATGKFSFRLVPQQDPRKIAAALDRYLAERCPPGLKMELNGFHGAPGVVVPLESPYMSAAAQAIEHGFGTAPVYIREGGSIPVVSSFYEVLGVDTLLLGWGLSDDNTHSPNEKFSLADFHRGIRASAHLWNELAKLRSK